MQINQAIGIFGDRVATELVRISNNPKDIDQSGWWAVTQTFEGKFQAFQFANVQPMEEVDLGPAYGPEINLEDWRPSLSSSQYEAAVQAIREDIARGWVYQANLCYVLTASLLTAFNPIAFYQLLREHNPAPYLSALYIPKNDSGLSDDIAICSASPELFLSRDGNQLTSSPIKGTAKSADQLLEKDRAENVMIVDLIRNDLSQVAIAGTVEVPELLRLEPHPGLVHLVSDVCGTISADTSWAQILEAMSPPGSVSGAPKKSALEVINRLEKTQREIYCGAFGFVDADTKIAKLAVGIRTFWETSNNGSRKLNFGTGAGITWGSDPAKEWAETQLKTKHLLHIANLKSS